VQKTTVKKKINLKEGNFMDQNQNLNQNVDTLFTNLENFTQNEGLIGKPVTHGDKTFMPVVSVTLGYGNGNTASKNSQGNQTTNTGAGNMAGGALGLGAKLNTEAIIVIDKDNVSLIPLSTTGAATQFIDKIPQMFMNMNQNKPQQGQQTNQTQGQQQNQQ
jgi:uncharacterized spore protein YtfJ